MIVPLDGDKEPITGFSYTNKRGKVEIVKIEVGSPTVEIVDASGGYTYFVWNEDIPKLVLALTKAHEEIQKREEA